VNISAFNCELRFEGKREVLGCEVTASSDALRSAVVVDWSEQNPAVLQSTIRISVPFLNPEEWFRIATLFDNTTVDCEVSFRMEGVRHTVTKNLRITAFAFELTDVLLSLYPPGLRQLAILLRDHLAKRRRLPK
jgi:hypothetical protein